MEVEGTFELKMALLQNGIRLTLMVTNEAHRTYFNGPNWIHIAKSEDGSWEGMHVISRRSR
jgi:hypothetical protein